MTEGAVTESDCRGALYTAESVIEGEFSAGSLHCGEADQYSP